MMFIGREGKRRNGVSKELGRTGNRKEGKNGNGIKGMNEREEDLGTTVLIITATTTTTTTTTTTMTTKITTTPATNTVKVKVVYSY